MAKKTEIVAEIVAKFPVELAEAPEVIEIATELAALTKTDLVEACVQAYPAAYPSKRKALAKPVEDLREDLAVALVATVLDSDDLYKPTPVAPFFAIRVKAIEFSRELTIRRLEAQAKAAIDRENMKRLEQAGVSEVRLRDGSTMDAREFVEKVTQTALGLISDHEKTHGRPAKGYEKKAAIRVAKAEIGGGYSPGDLRAMSLAESKRARKAAQNRTRLETIAS